MPLLKPLTLKVPVELVSVLNGIAVDLARFTEKPTAADLPPEKVATLVLSSALRSWRINGNYAALGIQDIAGATEFTSVSIH